MEDSTPITETIVIACGNTVSDTSKTGEMPAEPRDVEFPPDQTTITHHLTSSGKAANGQSTELHGQTVLTSAFLQSRNVVALRIGC
jgi:hypothetical protein